MKTKKVDKADLPASSFAYVGDPEDTSTWKLPIYFFADTKKAVNHIKDALARFAETKGIPENEREAVSLLVVGAALAHGIKVDRSQFASKSEKSKAVEPPAPAPKPPARVEKDLELDALIAMADRQAEAMLRAIGLE